MTARLLLLLLVVSFPISSPAASKTNANRLVYLMEPDPFSVDANFPKLTTPQWVGDSNVEAVVTLGIDDMRGSEPYEKFLRPILERLKKIDGRAPVNVFSVAPSPDDPQLQTWLKEGLSIEVHTLTHPCPILAKSNFVAAANTFYGCVDLLSAIPGNKPVAFRTPCCDSINSASPRLFAELMCKTGPDGKFLEMDSSVVMLFTTNDASIAAADLVDAQGKARFTKYVPFPAFKTTIENYPFPYVVNNVLWEMPFVAPSDWESFNIQGRNSPHMLEDWKKALDIIVKKRGIFNFVLHPHGWSTTNQFIEFIDYAEAAYGGKVKYLNYREALERFNKNLLGGQSLKDAAGNDNGVRLMDLNGDGFMDVVIGNAARRRTRVWDEGARKFKDSGFTVELAVGARFGIVYSNLVSVMVANESQRGAWTFVGGEWKEDRALLNGLEEILFVEKAKDRGARLRDVDNDRSCELLISNEAQNLVLKWDHALKKWSALEFGLPKGASIVNAAGEDNGLRFVDVNEDGFDDVIFSNERGYGLSLYIPKLYLGFARGWSRLASEGARSDGDAIPAFVRAGTNRHNGAWFHSKSLWVQNEDTAHLLDLVERRTFGELLVGARPAAKSPEEALKCFVLPEGFEIEEVASEPMVVDPVAFEWDANGRLWVVEMRDYPLGIDGKAGGVIKLLQDTDADGRYDKATEFLTQVNFPSGVMPWREGVLISAAPDLIYAEDTNGDGVADVRKVLVTGFREGNQQHRFNGFEFGMDGWVYGANGDSGGSLRVVDGVSSKSGAPAGEIRLRGDFRFKPDTGEFEVTEGVTQFGRRRDDWGNWFGNNNPNWLWHYYLPSRYVERNPNLRIADLRVMTAENNNLFPAGKTQQRFNDIGRGLPASAANSPAPYRDRLFGAEFANSVFISDPSFNLVHREVLVPDGVSFKSGRAESEREREFLASTDTWFRPTMVKTGPDGALYIADMYRFVLEHPEWIPPDVQKNMDLRAGEDKGRIYRVFPKGARLRKTPNLHVLPTPELAAKLDSVNGWERDTAQQLLVWRKDPTGESTVRKVARSGEIPQARAQALWTLETMGVVNGDDLLMALKDGDSRVRMQGIRASEAVGNANAKVIEAIAAVANGPERSLAFQAVLTLGYFNSPMASKAIAGAARKHADDRRFLNAVYSSALPHLQNLLADFADNGPANRAEIKVAAELFGLAGSRDAGAISGAVEALKRSSGPWHYAALGSLMEAVARRGGDTSSLLKNVSAIVESARATAIDGSADEDARANAIRLLGSQADLVALKQLLNDPSPVLQKAALAQLGKMRDVSAADTMLGAWGSLGPALRQESLAIIFTRTEWIEKLLSAVEDKKIPAYVIDASRQQSLRNHSSATIAEVAKQIFAAVEANRHDVLAKYENAESLSGDAANGASLFKQTCATCHRFRGEGAALGPDLGSVAQKPFDYLLAAILDPNQAVEARYIGYNAVAKDGAEFTGVISAETANSVTLAAANDLKQTFLREDLKQLNATGMSLMPEGLESGLGPQALADLIAYLRTQPAE